MTRDTSRDFLILITILLQLICHKSKHLNRDLMAFTFKVCSHYASASSKQCTQATNSRRVHMIIITSPKNVKRNEILGGIF